MKARHRDSTRVVRQAASVCLGYPEPDVIATSELLRAALAEEAPRQADSFEPLLAFWDSEKPSTIQTHYVDVFDLSRKHSLYLSYWTDGDTRRRGEVLAAFKQRYRRSGFPTICRWFWSTRRLSTQPMGLRYCRSTGAVRSCSG